MAEAENQHSREDETGSEMVGILHLLEFQGGKMSTSNRG